MSLYLDWTNTLVTLAISVVWSMETAKDLCSRFDNTYLFQVKQNY